MSKSCNTLMIAMISLNCLFSDFKSQYPSDIGTVEKEEKEVKFKQKKESKNIETDIKEHNRVKTPEETKEFIPEYFEEYSLFEAEDKIEIPLQPNDEDYEPPQWFRQQIKNDNKTINNEETIK